MIALYASNRGVKDGFEAVFFNKCDNGDDQ